MLKRIFAALFLACLLSSTAAFAAPAFTAEDYVTLGELREQAASGWNKTYAAMNREIKVTVDAPWMPDADACPIIEVAAWGKGDVPEDVLAPFQKHNLVSSSVSEQGLSFSASYDGFFLGKGYTGSRENSQDLYFWNGELPTEQPDGVALSYQEFLDRANTDLALVSDFSLNDFHIKKLHISGIVHVLVERNGEMVMGDPLMKSGYYQMWAYQKFHGIPMLHMAADMQDMPRGLFLYAYADAERFGLELAPGKELAMIEEDVPLLSFPAFQRVLEAQIDSGNLRGIEELEFGYAPLCEETSGDRTWMLMPVWRLKGGYTKDPEQAQEKVMPYHDPRDKADTLTVPMTYGDCYYSAQTGEMLPTSIVMQDSVKPLPVWDIVTWQSVGGKP